MNVIFGKAKIMGLKISFYFCMLYLNAKISLPVIMKSTQNNPSAFSPLTHRISWQPLSTRHIQRDMRERQRHRCLFLCYLFVLQTVFASVCLCRFDLLIHTKGEADLLHLFCCGLLHSFKLDTGMFN